MTTTTPVRSIRYTIQTGNLLSDGTPTRAALDRLAQMTAATLAVAFPGTSVECPIEHTSGVRPAGYTLVRMTDPGADDDGVRGWIDYIAGRAWESWCADLTDSDYVREDE